jgi:hypothetical protein
MILVVVRWAYLFVEEVCLKCGNPAGVPVVRLENCCWKLRAGHKDGLFVILHNIHYAQLRKFLTRALRAGTRLAGLLSQPHGM